MSARILGRYGRFEGLEHEFSEETTIGRDDANSLVLAIGSVSKRHARIYHVPEEDGYRLEDLGSLNGTRLDGLAVRGSERLTHLNVVSFGGSGDLVFQDLDRCARRHQAAPASAEAEGQVAAVGVAAADGEAVTAPPADEGAPEKTETELRVPSLPSKLADEKIPDSLDKTEDEGAPVVLPDFADSRSASKEVSPDRTVADLEAVILPGFLAEPEGADAEDREAAAGSSEPSAGLDAPPSEVGDVSVRERVLEVEIAGGPTKEVSLPLGVFVLGRGEDCDYQLGSAHLSRRHAALRVTEDGVFVRDLGSKNGTVVDGRALDGEVELEPEQELLLGDVQARWRIR